MYYSYVFNALDIVGLFENVISSLKTKLIARHASYKEKIYFQNINF
jgi:hypothetical protein